MTGQSTSWPVIRPMINDPTILAGKSMNKAPPYCSVRPSVVTHILCDRGQRKSLIGWPNEFDEQSPPKNRPMNARIVTPMVENRDRYKICSQFPSLHMLDAIDLSSLSSSSSSYDSSSGVVAAPFPPIIISELSLAEAEASSSFRSSQLTAAAASPSFPAAETTGGSTLERDGEASKTEPSKEHLIVSKPKLSCNCKLHESS
mmetsp:Transcript_10229/g.25076  ORF Transcript_10229/g.25076 Transcript_10229/m.25076 type:complete len:202 (-) Transcript_10229:31-636(-)